MPSDLSRAVRAELDVELAYGLYRFKTVAWCLTWAS